MNPIVREIIAGARQHTAVDAFKAAYRLEKLRRSASQEWSRMDLLITPTTGTIYTHEAVAAAPVQRNTDLGYYTNFVNLLDLAAVAVPAGLRADGLHSGSRWLTRLQRRSLLIWRTGSIGLAWTYQDRHYVRVQYRLAVSLWPSWALT
jgi:hypothetical protein